MESIRALSLVMFAFAFPSSGVKFASAYGYPGKDAPIETGPSNNPMNYFPGEGFQGNPLPHPEYVSSEDKLPESVIKENHHRRRRRCRNKGSEGYCYQVLLHGRCEEKYQRKRCRKTCSTCKDRRECKDSLRTCMYASAYTCSQGWFARGCRKSCNLCETKTTSQPATTTTAETKKECKDRRSNCKYATKYTCAHLAIRWGCQKSCGVCVPETTTVTVPTQTTTTMALTSESSSPPTTTRTTTTVPLPSVTPTTTIATTLTTKFGKTLEPEPETEEPEVTETTPAETEAPGTTMISGGTGATPEGTAEPLVCVDQDEKNCHVWESIGLCYNPKFMEETIKLCPFSCDACATDYFSS